MPCPFAPLLGLLPTLLAVPYVAVLRLRKAKAKLNKKFSEDEIVAAEQTGIRLEANGQLRLALEVTGVDRFEFYHAKVPHVRAKQAVSTGSVGESHFLLFSEDACSARAEAVAKVLHSSGLALASLKENELKGKVVDSLSFQNYGMERFVRDLNAL